MRTLRCQTPLATVHGALLSQRLKRVPRSRSRTRREGSPWAVRQGKPKDPSPTRPPQSAECGAPSAEAGVRPGAGDARCILTGGRTHGAVRSGVLEDAVTPGGLRSPPVLAGPLPHRLPAPGMPWGPASARQQPDSEAPASPLHRAGNLVVRWAPCPGARAPEQGPQSEGPGVRSGFCLGTACRRG